MSQSFTALGVSAPVTGALARLGIVSPFGRRLAAVVEEHPHQGPTTEPRNELLGPYWLFLRLLGLPLLFQRLLRRLLCHALLRVLVLGRHALTSLGGAVRLSAAAQAIGGDASETIA